MDFILREAFQYLGMPYRWGGNNPVSGFDCSGLVQWLLRSAGIDPVGDQTAQGLFDIFEKKYGVTNVTKAGVICFYGAHIAAISHVAFCIDSFRVIEAGGGDHTTVSRDVAEKQGACVRISHVSHRKDLVAKIQPDYATIGLI